LVAILGNNVVKANCVQLDDFTGIDVESGMLLQFMFENFYYSFSAQALVKCLHMCYHNIKH